MRSTITAETPVMSIAEAIAALQAIQERAVICAVHLDCTLRLAVVPAPQPGVGKVNTKAIREAVAAYFSLSDGLTSQSKRDAAWARQIAMYLCRLHTNQSLSAIARPYCMHHTTVMHAVRKIAGLVAIGDVKAALDVRGIESRLFGPAGKLGAQEQS